MDRIKRRAFGYSKRESNIHLTESLLRRKMWTDEGRFRPFKRNQTQAVEPVHDRRFGQAGLYKRLVAEWH